ncbi:MAG: T9SS type A sorting domain-containing protein [Bacteroidetes bacterium]|nr:T9SS type A sorting domain-containing protein [Bacteroidota bacterium]
MKKIYLSLLTALAGLSLNAQTLTNANHSPAAGDLYSTYQCDSLGISAGASGAAALWNFTSVATHSSIVNNYTATANANASYPIPGVQLGSAASNLSFYKSTATNLTYWGGNVTIGAIAATFVYTISAVRAAYPMSLNTTSTAATAGSISIPALSQTGTFTGNSTTLADGTGTLALITGTFTSAIRVVTSQTINFSVQLGTGSVTQKNWDYFDIGTKEALFTISTATIVAPLVGTSTQTIVTRHKPLVTGLSTNNNNKTVDMIVYPNPSNTNVNFATENTDAKTVVVYDVTGKMVEKQNLTEGKLRLNVSDYTNGLYIYSIIGSNNQAIKTGKITVSH